MCRRIVGRRHLVTAFADDLTVRYNNTSEGTAEAFVHTLTGKLDRPAHEFFVLFGHLLFCFQLDLVKVLPVFAGNEDAVAGLIVCDAVESVLDLVLALLVGWRDAREIDPAEQRAVGRIDPGDVIRPADLFRMPDVRPYLALYHLKLIKLHKRPARFVADNDRANRLQGLGTDDSDDVSAVAHDQVGAVVGQAPALAGVTQFAKELEIGEAIDPGRLIAPRKLVDLIADNSDPFGEHLIRQVIFLHDLTGLDIHLSQCRFTFLSRALIKKAVAKSESLRECFGIVRVCFYDLVT